MLNDDFLKKLHALNDKLRADRDTLSDSHPTNVLARTAKVSEEYGELIDEILSHLKLQRQNKLDKYQPQNLEKEYGDVIITLLLLGLSLDIDIKKVVTARLAEKYTEHIGPSSI
jgi:NTP pyrophosphatase (non-canonical NTP hydrolase)